MDEQTAAEILRMVNGLSEAFQRTMTEAEVAALQAKQANEPGSAVAYSASNREEALTDFTAEALETLAADIRSVLDGRWELLYRQALEVYYTTEDLARDPENAHLLEHVEAMRRAHEKEYGCPPPPRE